MKLAVTNYKSLYLKRREALCSRIFDLVALQKEMLLAVFDGATAEELLAATSSLQAQQRRCYGELTEDYAERAEWDARTT